MIQLKNKNLSMRLVMIIFKKKSIKSFFVCSFFLTVVFSVSAIQKKLPPAGCIITTTETAICDNTKYCNCAISNSGDAICTNDNCIAALSTGGHASCHGPSCVAAVVTNGSAECKGESCSLVATAVGSRVCSGGKCDCVDQISHLKGSCADELNEIVNFLQGEKNLVRQYYLPKMHTSNNTY